MSPKREPPLVDCQHCVAEHLCELFDLSNKESEQLAPLLSFHHYEPHQTIFYEGKPCLGLYILCAGKAKLVQSSWSGQQHILKIVTSGEVIEKNALFDETTHSVTCEALERCQVGFLTRDRFYELLAGHPGMAVKFIKALSKELHAAYQKLMAATFESARECMAGTLLQLGRQHGVPHPDGRLIAIALSREELAEMAGVSVETAVRLLTKFKEEQLIAANGKEIILCNIDRLSRICHTLPPM